MNLTRYVTIAGFTATVVPATLLAEEELAASVSSPLSGNDEESSYIQEPATRYHLRVAAFIPRVTSSARVDLGTTGGTTVDFEKIGLPKEKTSLDLELDVLLNRRWYLGFEYFSLNRSATNVLDDEITWNGDTFPVSTQVNTHFNFAIYRFAAGYNLFQNEDSKFTLTFGTHLTDSEFGIASRASIGDASTESIGSVEALTFPLPNVGLLWQMQLSEHWKAQIRGDFFAIGIENYDGDLMSADVRIDYLITREISIGISYSYFDLDVDYDGQTWAGNVNFHFYGPKVNVGYRW